MRAHHAHDSDSDSSDADALQRQRSHQHHQSYASRTHSTHEPTSGNDSDVYAHRRHRHGGDDGRHDVLPLRWLHAVHDTNAADDTRVLLHAATTTTDTTTATTAACDRDARELECVFASVDADVLCDNDEGDDKQWAGATMTTSFARHATTSRDAVGGAVERRQHVDDCHRIALDTDAKAVDEVVGVCATSPSSSPSPPAHAAATAPDDDNNGNAAASSSSSPSHGHTRHRRGGMACVRRVLRWYVRRLCGADASRSVYGLYPILREQAVTFVFVCTTLTVFAVLAHYAFYALNDHTLPLFLPAFGASATMVFAVPKSPMSQPRVVLFAHMTAALIGVALANALQHTANVTTGQYMAGALGVGVHLALMQCTNMLHPPASATVVSAALAPMNAYYRDRGFLFLVTPTLCGTLLVLVMACLLNNLVASHAPYPQFW